MYRKRSVCLFFYSEAIAWASIGFFPPLRPYVEQRTSRQTWTSASLVKCLQYFVAVNLENQANMFIMVVNVCIIFSFIFSVSFAYYFVSCHVCWYGRCVVCIAIAPKLTMCSLFWRIEIENYFFTFRHPPLFLRHHTQHALHNSWSAIYSNQV